MKLKPWFVLMHTHADILQALTTMQPEVLLLCLILRQEFEVF